MYKIEFVQIMFPGENLGPYFDILDGGYWG